MINNKQLIMRTITSNNKDNNTLIKYCKYQMNNIFRYRLIIIIIIRIYLISQN